MNQNYTKCQMNFPKYAQYPNPQPEVFGQNRPEPNPKQKSPTRHGLPMRTWLILSEVFSRSSISFIWTLFCTPFVVLQVLKNGINTTKLAQIGRRVDQGPRGQGSGLQGPRGSKGRPTGSKEVKWQARQHFVEHSSMTRYTSAIVSVYLDMDLGYLSGVGQVNIPSQQQYLY